MSGEGVSLQYTEDGFAILQMNNGQNRFNTPFIKSLTSALDDVLKNSSCKALITTSAGKFYSNGIDLDWLFQQSSDDRLEFMRSLNDLMWKIMWYPLPTVAAINGHAFAGGAFLAMVHDYRVMREDRGWICWNETHIKMRFPDNLLEILRLKVPRSDALRESVIYGRRITAPEARQLDLVDVVAELSNLIPEAKKLATSALGKTGIDRDMLSVMKQDIYPRTIKANM